MKPSTIALIFVCVAATAGAIVYLNRQKTPPAPVPLAASMSEPAEQSPPEKMIAPKPEPPRAVSENASRLAQAPVTNSLSDNLKPKASAKLSQAIDALLSPSVTAMEKHAIFQRLQKAGELEQAIAELKQRAADSPNDPEIPATLGEAQINQLRAIRDAGGDYNQIGILAMQADQSFNEALKLDPANWEAQFMKAASMSRWPADPARDNEVVQRLSSLIDQQETMAPQPQFAQTYVVLGDQYQKIGKPDYAQQTWQLGLTKFPGDSTLQKRISSPPGR